MGMSMFLKKTYKGATNVVQTVHCVSILGHIRCGWEARLHEGKREPRFGSPEIPPSPPGQLDNHFMQNAGAKVK
jgi:hypothetical protein